MLINTNPGQWVRAFGGSINHLIIGRSKTDSVTGLNNLIFACGKKSVWSQWGYDSSKKKCPRCVSAEHRVQADATPPTVSNPSDQSA